MKKPSPEMLKKIKNLLTNSTKLENNPKLKQKIQTYLRKLKSNAKEASRRSKTLTGKSRNGRGSRNMKLKLSSTSTNSTKIHKTKKGTSKSDSKKRLMLLLSVAKKKMQDERKARTTNLQQSPVPPKNNKTNRLTSRPQAPRNRQFNPPPKSRQSNYESHPIWDYFHKLQGGSAQPPTSRARRLTRRLF